MTWPFLLSSPLLRTLASHLCPARTIHTHDYQDWVHEPRLVRELSDEGHAVIAVAAGRDTSYALTAGGAAFAWGYGYNGRLGTGTHESQLVPREVLADDLRGWR